MPPNDGSGQAIQMARERIDLLRQKLRATPAPVKAVLVAAVLVLVVMTPFLWGRVAYLIVVVPLLYGPVAVVRAEVHYGQPPHQEYRDLWVIHLGGDGRCTWFEEWPFWPEHPYAARDDHP